MAQPTVRLLMTATGGEMVPQLFQLLKQSQRYAIKVLAIDMSPLAVGQYFADHFSVVPKATDEGYIDAIATLCQQHAIDIILPASDEEAFIMAAHREQFEQNGKRYLACPPIDVLQLITDKTQTYQSLQQAGIAVPYWRSVANEQQLWGAVEELLAQHHDAVIKPIAERGGRGIYVIDNQLPIGHIKLVAREQHMHIDTLKQKLQEKLFKVTDFPMMVMQRLCDPVYDIDILSWQGKAINVIPRRRLHSAFPNLGHELVDDAVLNELAHRVIETLNLSALQDIDVMYDQSGQPYILEVNPRPSGSFVVTLAGGIPLIDNLIALTRGELSIPVTNIPGCKLVAYKSLKVIAE